MIHLSRLAALFVAAIPVYATPFAFVQALVQTGTDGTLYNQSPALGVPDSLITASWTCDTCSAYGFSANGAGTVNFGTLGSTVTVSVSAAPGPDSIAIPETIAAYTDTLTITGGSGAGVLALAYTLDGSISVTGTGPQGVTAVFPMCDDNGCNDGSIYYSLNSGALTALSSGQPGFRSNGTVIFYIPFTYGAPLDIEPFLSTQAQFIVGSDSIPFSASANFNDTVTLSSALVYGGTPSAPGTQNNGALIDAASGLDYGPDGIVSGTPEPATVLLTATALAALIFFRRKLTPPERATPSSRA